VKQIISQPTNYMSLGPTMYKLKLPPDCPNSDAKEFEMQLYRILQSDCLDDADLLSYAETNGRLTNQCKAHGLSFYKSYAGVLSTYKAAVQRNRILGTHIAKVQIQPKHGRLHTTDGDHFTLWVYSGITAADFRCVSVHEVKERDES
jgi:hypothetical protein